MKKYNILFLCTHNSARSVLGEAIASTHPSDRFVGYSAGSTPGTKVNPFAAELAKEMGYPEEKLSSKSWDVYGKADAQVKCVHYGQASHRLRTGVTLIHHKFRALTMTRGVRSKK
jgi:Low molecular weight phosphotyrosine protein phosphatase